MNKKQSVMRNKFLWILLLSCLGYSQNPEMNWVKTKVYKQPYTASISTPTILQASTQVGFFDGLGRGVLVKDYAASADGTDVVTHIEYDALGRQLKEYLPYARTSGADLNFEEGAYEETVEYYVDNYDDTTPYSEKEVEVSPRQNILKQAAPGTQWKKTSGHEIKFDYKANTSGEVIAFKADATWNPSTKIYNITLQNQTANYGEKQLYKTITVDENHTGFSGPRTEEFKDKQGRVVLKRIWSDINTVLTKHDTYYVYDQYGNLTYVIPPAVITGSTLTTEILSGLCYQYKYDYRNRMVAKKLPGKNWEFIVYDNLNRVRSTGPVLSPFKNISGEGWLITKYDAFDRPILAAWHPTTVSESGRLSIISGIENAQQISETTGTSTVNNVTFGYTNTSYPATNYHVLIVDYFDNYSYPNAPADFSNVLTQSVRDNSSFSCKTMSTGSWVRRLENTTDLFGETTYTLYLDDHRALPARTETNHTYSGYTKVDTKYDNFEGKVEQTQTRHKKTINDDEVLIVENFTYTDQSRLESHTHKVNNFPVENLVTNTYDPLGNLESKEVGNTALSPYQQVDYTYNIRGWLTGINKDQLDNLTDDLFAFRINYNEPLTGVTPLYNGNINATFWNSDSDNKKRSYTYTYDDLNRLEIAKYQNLYDTSIVDTYNETITYDKNGNIQTLERNGTFEDPLSTVEIDDLVYTYDDEKKNQLKRVMDSSNSTEGFKDVHFGNYDYLYDDYGNMTYDQNKNINSITYNHLNLPMTITFGTGATITYTYDASGVKLKKKVTDGNTVSTTEYYGGFQYNNNVLQFFPTAEGYVKHTIDQGDYSVYDYIYQYKDHLGNVRMNYAFDDSNDALGILDEHHYYPFGLEHTYYNTTKREFRKKAEDPGTILELVPNSGYQYKYNGKEYQDELDLNWHDYQARNYDPALGRWFNIDPASELSRRYSPYAYALDNPVYFIDPDGMYAGGFNIADNEGVDTDYKILKKDKKNKNGDVTQKAGSIVRVDPDDKSDQRTDDRLFATDDNGNVNETKIPLTIDKENASDSTVISDLAAGGKKGERKRDLIWTSTENKQDAFDVFQFAALNSNAEWSLQANRVDGNTVYALGTYHMDNRAPNFNHPVFGLGFNRGYHLYDIHSHLRTDGPSQGDLDAPLSQLTTRYIYTNIKGKKGYLWRYGKGFKTPRQSDNKIKMGKLHLYF